KNLASTRQGKNSVAKISWRQTSRAPCWAASSMKRIALATLSDFDSPQAICTPATSMMSPFSNRDPLLDLDPVRPHVPEGRHVEPLPDRDLVLDLAGIEEKLGDPVEVIDHDLVDDHLVPIHLHDVAHVLGRHTKLA